MYRKTVQFTILIALAATSRLPVYALQNKPVSNTSFDVIVSKRDTLQSIFTRYGLNKKDLYQMLEQVDKGPLSKIKPGQLVHFDTVKGRKVQEMKIFCSNEDFIQVSNEKGVYKLTNVVKSKKGFYTKVEFDLKKNLYIDGRKNKLTAAHLAEIDQVMKTDPSIDPRRFAPGTKVAVILEGANANSAKKVVAVHVLQGKKKWSVTRFNDKYSNNFYHTDGTTAAVSFLKYPLKKFRISSPFSTSRMHPTLHYRRPHYGVDLAAAQGSPIWATAQGKVVFVGTKGGYGKTVILQHGSQYQAIYGHLSRFGKGLKSGDIVKQKQIIGYVGSTGHATGPHLHYELRRKGVPIDPMRAKLPSKSRLKGDLYSAFQKYQAHIIRSLNTVEKKVDLHRG